MTRIQASVFDTIKQTSAHLTADQVFASVRQMHPTVSVSTVYRNLNLFADAGIIRRIQRANGPDYFERNTAAHDHAYCIKCGNITDFNITELKGFLVKHFEYPILSFELLINYVCPDCKDK